MFNKLPKHPLSNYYLALIAAYIIWAATGPVIKLTLEFIPPFTTLLFRFIIVCVVLLPYAIYRLRREAIHPADLSKIILVGLLSQGSLLICFLGYKYTTAIEATLISLLGPVLAVAAGHYYYHEKTNLYIKIGLVTASLGTLFIAIEPILNPNYAAGDIKFRMLGNILIILYNLIFLLYIIWFKLIIGEKSSELKRTLKQFRITPMKKVYSPIFLATISFYIGLLVFIPMAFLELNGFFGPVNFDFASLTITPIISTLFLALFGSISANFFFEWSLSKVEVKDTGLFSYMGPVLTVPFAYILLKELPNVYMIVGSIIIAVGVLIAENKKS